MTAWWWRMIPQTFEALPSDEQARMRAAYRIHHRIEAIQGMPKTTTAFDGFKPKGGKGKGRSWL